MSIALALLGKWTKNAFHFDGPATRFGTLESLAVRKTPWEMVPDGFAYGFGVKDKAETAVERLWTTERRPGRLFVDEQTFLMSLCTEVQFY